MPARNKPIPEKQQKEEIIFIHTLLFRGLLNVWRIAKYLSITSPTYFTKVSPFPFKARF